MLIDLAILLIFQNTISNQLMLLCKPKYLYKLYTSSFYALKMPQKVPIISPANSALALFKALCRLSAGIKCF